MNVAHFEASESKDVIGMAINIGKTIRLLRINAGIKQKDLAHTLGITPSYLSLVETGKKQPGRRLIERAAEKLGVPVSYIFRHNERPKDITKEQEELFDLLKDVIWKLQALQTAQVLEVEEETEQVASEHTSIPTDESANLGGDS